MLQARAPQLARPRRKTHILLTHVFGYTTRKPPIRPLVVADLRIRRRPPVRSRFIRPVAPPPPAPPRGVKPLRVLLVRRRAQPRIHSKFTAVFGRSTRKPPVRALRVLLARIKRPRGRVRVLKPAVRPLLFPPPPHILLVPGRKPTPGRVLLRKKVRRYSTVNPPIRRLRVLLVRVRRPLRTLVRVIRPVVHAVVARHVRALQVVLTRIRRRPPTRVQFFKPVGRHATAPPPIHPLLVAAVRIRRRPPTHSQFVKPVVRPVVVVARHVRTLTVVLRRVRRVAVTIKPKFLRVFGRLTAPPPIRAPRVLLAPSHKRTPGRVRLGRPVGRHATRKPPIYPIRVAAMRRPRLRRGSARYEHVVRTFAPTPPPVSDQHLLYIMGHGL